MHACARTRARALSAQGAVGRTAAQVQSSVVPRGMLAAGQGGAIQRPGKDRLQDNERASGREREREREGGGGMQDNETIRSCVVSSVAAAGLAVVPQTNRRYSRPGEDRAA